jgi:carbonic anhydrase/acetyltransferase-like protein (isoleucine patch superfamily)
VFKSDYIRMGSACSIGPGAFVHYGTTMGDHVVLDADAFLMKGETLDSHSGWRGNPAKMVRGGVAPQPEKPVADDAGWREPALQRLAAE